MNFDMGAALTEVYDTQVRITPEHKDHIDKRLAKTSPGEREMLEQIATMILRLTGRQLPRTCEGYSWICNVVLEEELYFRRHGGYRLSKFEDALAEIYSVPEKMVPYMDGLLMTQLWWPNHTASISYLKTRFLPALADGYELLEVGPGHGLLLSFPAQDPRSSHVEAWDLSEASLSATSSALRNIGVTREVILKDQNLFEADPGKRKFDAIIFSEVLEHMDEPKRALLSLKSILKDRGRIYIHMPINSPSPDHLFNLPTPEAVVQFVESCGLEVVDSEFAPMMGKSLEQCMKHKLSISCLLTAQNLA
jgi:2-polyprenyl-3-methyl-5-hydroxy-6-metoxy-1,4-benzoquinol methylase